GLHERRGLQYHWQNAGYATFEDFLSRFNAKRRHQIRRERRAPEEQGVDIEVLSGRDIDPPLVDAFYDFYRSTVERHFYGRLYLDRAFFEELVVRAPSSILAVLARDRASRRPIAGAWNLVGGGVLYGRYWGAREERPFLHFNVCFYRGIEECIARGIRRFEPGAGGEHKLARGFEPAVTRSLHHLGHPVLDAAVADFLARERAAVATHLDEYAEGPVLRR
ncbi:MAG: GNAT family N-acetyltransferase, partial [Deltaproteobacteria bacterium]|nr:GNAT family N-acetyltransferase [Deltaproteobacteria bacterium]